MKKQRKSTLRRMQLHVTAPPEVSTRVLAMFMQHALDGWREDISDTSSISFLKELHAVEVHFRGEEWQ